MDKSNKQVLHLLSCLDMLTCIADEQASRQMVSRIEEQLAKLTSAGVLTPENEQHLRNLMKDALSKQVLYEQATRR